MILTLRALGIGDLCAAVPALRALRAACPDQELALAAPRWLGPLVELGGLADRLVPVPDLVERPWPATARRPVLGVNLHGRGPQSHTLLAGAAPARLVAFACPAAGHSCGPLWRDDEHEVYRWCRLLRWHGIPADPRDLLLPRSPARAAILAGTVPSGTTVLHPGAKSADRRWPPERFATVASALAGAGHRVVVTGSPADVPLAQRVAHRASLPDDAVLAGRTDTGALAALVAHATLVVSGDTGVGHLATAYGTPSVLLFGRTPPGHWGPPAYRRQHRVIWHGTETPIADIEVGEVIEQVRALEEEDQITEQGEHRWR